MSDQLVPIHPTCLLNLVSECVHADSLPLWLLLYDGGDMVPAYDWWLTCCVLAVAVVKMKQLEAGSEGAKPVTSGQRRAEQASAAAAATAAAAAESLDPDVLKVYDSNIEMTPTYYEADHVDADDIVEAPTHLIAEALRQIGFHPFEAMELALYMNDVQWIRKQHQVYVCAVVCEWMRGRKLRVNVKLRLS